MKAKLYDMIELLVEIESDNHTIIPSGTHGAIIDIFDDPEGYTAEFTVPNITEATGDEYLIATIFPNQFRVVWTAEL